MAKRILVQTVIKSVAFRYGSATWLPCIGAMKTGYNRGECATEQSKVRCQRKCGVRWMVPLSCAAVTATEISEHPWVVCSMIHYAFLQYRENDVFAQSFAERPGGVRLDEAYD